MPKSKGKSQSKAAVRSTPATPARQVRIIGGVWKRTPLPVLDADGLRPTPDRVRETVFNWLTHLLDGAWSNVRCLDLFAGTGALGFEAASRGAAHVLLVEASSAAAQQLAATKQKLQAQQVEIIRGDAQSIMRRLAANEQSARFDLIFLDPPYHQDWLAKMLPVCEFLLNDGGIIYAESELPLDSAAEISWMSAWEVIRADHAGLVFYHLLQRKTQPGFEA